MPYGKFGEGGTCALGQLVKFITSSGQKQLAGSRHPSLRTQNEAGRNGKGQLAAAADRRGPALSAVAVNRSAKRPCDAECSGKSGSLRPCPPVCASSESGRNRSPWRATASLPSARG